MIAAYCVNEFVLKEEDSGITGTYEYTTEGTYNSGTMGYKGTWEISLDTGNVIKSHRDVAGTLTQNVSDGVTVDVNDPSPVPASEDPDRIIDQNGLLDGSEYIGELTIETSNYGKKDVSVFMKDGVWYYADNDGVVYRIILTNTVFMESGNAFNMVFELK